MLSISQISSICFFKMFRRSKPHGLAFNIYIFVLPEIIFFNFTLEVIH